MTNVVSDLRANGSCCLAQVRGEGSEGVSKYATRHLVFIRAVNRAVKRGERSLWARQGLC